MKRNMWMIGMASAALLSGLSTVAWAEDPKPAPAPAPAAQPPAPAPAADPAAAQATENSKARMELSSADWDFGTVWQGEPVKNTFTIKNTGTDPLTIQVKSSCGCTVPSKPTSPLAPGESTEFSIEYNTKKRKGPANQTVTVTTNDPERKNTTIRVHGEVKELIKMEPNDGVYFGQLYEDSVDTKSIKLSPQTDESMKLKIKDGQDFGMYKVELKELEAGKSYELSATTVPPLEVGSPKSRVEVVLETGLSKMNEMTVSVHGAVLPAVQVQPNKVFVPQNLSTKLTRQVQIRYAPTKPIKILEVKSDLPAITAALKETPNAQPQGNTMAFHMIEITVESAASLPTGGGKVTVMTDSADARFKAIEIPVQIVQRAQPPRPTSNPAGTTSATPPGGGKWEPVPANDPATLTQKPADVTAAAPVGEKKPG